MEETNTLLLKDDEVKRYHKLVETFDEAVSDAAERDSDINRSVKYFWMFVLFMGVLWISINLFSRCQ